MPVTARQYAEYLVSRMEATGRKIVVYVRNGQVVSTAEGSAFFEKVAAENLPIVGYYDPECLTRHLAEDLKEFFPA